MAIIKCKMCGGDIELTAEKTFGTCEFCGSTMTLPKLDDDQRAIAFNRGNYFRRIGEFDKALAVYERIVREDDTDAEAHWCCALCRFGIEYVEDPTTYEWLPTCHRASFDSFLEDVDYRAALENSTGITRRQYMKDGTKIAEVQKGILAASQNAEPYDVFICYKESDENGHRTRDSLLAQEIYYQLTEQGRKVFFSRITLEDVAGTQYEPYIFAALNSAKVMIVVGTKAEYLNSVWVKNEWSRFLAMMKKDRHKLLLPCYRDMDPYDMPEQLSVLQSYDMSKIGFLQDLTRGIAKILDAEKGPVPAKERVVVHQNAVPVVNIVPLLKRVSIFLEDGEWDRADDFCEQVLNSDPECAQAYLGKLMAELHVHKQSDLCNSEEPFDSYNNYKNAYRFGDAQLRETLTGYIRYINDRNENTRLEGIYQIAWNKMNAAQSEQAFLIAAQEFDSIRNYKDAATLVKECKEKAIASQKDVLYDAAKNLMVGSDIANYQKAIKRFEELDNWRDSQEKIRTCRRKIREIEVAKEQERLEKLYLEAIGQLEKANNEEKYKAAARLFAAIEDYKDSADLAQKCLEKAEASRKDILYAAAMNMMTGNKISNYREAIKRFEELEGWRDSVGQIALCQQKIKEIESRIEMQRLEHARQEAQKERQRLEKLYREAVRELERANNEEKYKAVAKLFAAVGGYKDSAQLTQQCLEKAEESRKNAIYASAKKKMSGNRIFNYQEAITRFEELGDWKDSLELIEVCRQRIADIEAGNVQPAPQSQRKRKVGLIVVALASIVIVVAVVLTMVVMPNNRYQDAVALMDSGNYEAAIIAFEALDGYKDSEDRITQCKAVMLEQQTHIADVPEDPTEITEPAELVHLENIYNEAVRQMNEGDILAALCSFSEVGDYKDAMTQTIRLRKYYQKLNQQTTISAGSAESSQMNGSTNTCTVGLKADGTIVAVGSDGAGQCDVTGWKNIISIETSGLHTVGLKANGTVVATGLNDYGQCDVADWTDIIAILADRNHTVGLKADGTVVATGYNYFGQCDVADWTDIVAISEGMNYTAGLKADGTVIIAGANRADEATSWTDMVAISASPFHMVGLKADGTVVADGNSGNSQCNVADWTDIVAVSAGRKHTVGLKSDGTVVATGLNYDGQCNVSSWTDIVAIDAGVTCTIGLKSNGTLVIAGDFNYYEAISDWKDIKIPTVVPSLYTTPSTISAASHYTVGLRKDGTVVSAGEDYFGKHDVRGWRNIISVSAGSNHTVGLKADGTVVAVGSYQYQYGQCDVSDWKDIIAISAGDGHTVGLKKDGTAIATGNHANGRCDLSEWSNIIDVSAGSFYTVGLKADGTIVSTDATIDAIIDKQGTWTDIIAISAGPHHLVGLKADGTVVSTNEDYIDTRWMDIVAISAGDQYTFVLKKDGTVDAVGKTDYYGEYDVSDWSDIVDISAATYHVIGLKADGTVVSAASNATNLNYRTYYNSSRYAVSGWKNIRIP